MNHPAVHVPVDIEKTAGTIDISSNSPSSENVSDPVAPIHIPPKLSKWNQRIENLSGLEARGITRVLPEERHKASVIGYVQMAILWFSANVSANNLAVGMLGPLLFNLGFLDSAMCAVFGIMVGSAATAYTSIWGAQSGNRTMVSMDGGPLVQDQSWLTKSIDCRSLLHGLLARQASLLSQHDPYGWIRYDRLHYRRADPLRSQRRRHVNLGGHRHCGPGQLAGGCVWHGYLPRLREVRRTILSSPERCAMDHG